MRSLARALPALCCLFALPASAVQCNVSVQSLTFGSYDTFSSQPLDSTGNVAVSCDVATAYSIALSPGGGTYASRALASGAHRLDYNAYTDATRTAVWGDGTGGSATVAGSGTSANHTVYGRIFARQNAHIGFYADTLTVTLTY
jgi:spore coat protein U-like protein